MIDRIVISTDALEPADFVMARFIPIKAAKPSPEDGAFGVDPDTVLSWSPLGSGDFQYDVYFGTDRENIPLAFSLWQLDSFDPSVDGRLEWSTKYYWRIDQRNDENIYEGDVWSFTTITPYCGGPLPGDINGDCIVNLADLMLLIDNWLYGY